MKKFIVFTYILLAGAVLMALNPKEEYEFTPDMFGMNYEEVKIETEDGLKLNGWMIKPMEKSKKVMVFCHSGEGNMADFLDVAGQFISLKYNVLLFDYRGFGSSEDGGLKISPKFYIYSQFVMDVKAALDYVGKYHAVYSVDMYGTGMGAGLAVSVAANRAEVGKVIGDGTYISLEKIQRAWEEAHGDKIFVPFGYDKVWMEPLFALDDQGDHLDGILLIASDDDPIVTAEDTEELKKLHRKIEIHEVDSDSNAENFNVNKDAYFKRIKKFLEG